MISTLHIKNIGIIDDICIDFSSGFNVLTGETGSGKTLIIDSLDIISGGRFSKEMIRNGENYSFVEACIYLPNHKDSIDGNIIVSREIYLNGRNNCKINGRLVTVTELKCFMKNIINIHGQHDNQNIMDISYHINYLDAFIGEEINFIKIKYQNLLEEFNEIKNELRKNYGDEKEKQRKIDLLKYQINEIEIANLKIDEEKELEEKRKILMNSEKIMQNLNIIDEALDTKVIDGLNVAIKSLEKIENYNPNFEEKLNILRNSYYDIQEIAIEICSNKSNIEYDEQSIEEIETRLDLINSLRRKYGNTIEEILQYKEETEEEINKILNMEEYINNLKEKQENTEKQMIDLCIKMNELRNKYGEILSNKINNELKDLDMKNARFKIKIDIKKGEYNKQGYNYVEFYISTNIGEDYKQLTKIASGGELSRIMLAIKSVLVDIDDVDIMIFDEIDTGISGLAAKAVSQKMSRISKKHQILVITHLPIIAAVADDNFYISKEVNNNKTRTNVKKLKGEEIIEELARMSTGEITKISIQNAKELRNSKINEIKTA